MTIYDKLVAEANQYNFTKVESFAYWYNSHGNPIISNGMNEIYETDDALSIPIFRWRNFQVEQYIVHSPDKIPLHSHPFVDVIQQLYFRRTEMWSGLGTKLVYPKIHGQFVNPDDMAADEKALIDSRGMIITYERWDPRVPVTTLAATWKGETVGPLQEKLIKRLYPNAEVREGYADVTIGMDIYNDL